MQIQQQIISNLIWRTFFFASQFIVNLCLARILEASEYGRLFFHVNNLSLLIMILSLSLDSSVGFHIANKKDPARKLPLFSIKWIGGILLLVIVAAVFAYYMRLADASTLSLWCAFIAGMMMQSFFIAIFNAEGQFRTPNLLLSVSNTVLCGIYLLNAYYPFLHMGDITALFYIVTLVQGLTLVIYYYAVVRKPMVLAPGARDASGRAVFVYAGHALLANVVFFLLYRSDYWFVEAWCSENDLGNYIQTAKLAHVIIVIPSIIAAVILPQVASGNKQALDITGAFSKLTGILLLLCGIVVLFWGSTTFTWLFGPSYNSMHTLFLLILPGIYFLTVQTLLSAWIAGMNRVKWNIISAGGGLAITLAGNAVFTPLHGVKAAAIISSLSYCGTMLISLWYISGIQPGIIRTLFRFSKKDIVVIRNFLPKRTMP